MNWLSNFITGVEYNKFSYSYVKTISIRDIYVTNIEIIRKTKRMRGQKQMVRFYKNVGGL